jgi:Rrf2 family transcriptional regulator, iron-sulfur cluster assembly transcription factor
MTILSQKELLPIAVVVDVALQKDRRRISSKTLATRHDLPARHLELMLQSLVRDGVLKGIRGPRGGYELGRDRNGITANDILGAAGTVDEETAEPTSVIVTQVVLPLLAAAEQAFGHALNQITLDGMVRNVELGSGKGRDEAAEAPKAEAAAMRA